MQLVVVLVYMVLVSMAIAGKREDLDFISCVVHEDYFGIEKIRVKPASKPKSKPKSKLKPISTSNYFDLGENIAVKVDTCSSVCSLFTLRQIYGTPTKAIDGGVINVNVTGPEDFGLQHFEADVCELFRCPLTIGKSFRTKFKVPTDECSPPGNYTVVHSQ